jgi:hypothetical protein
MAEFDRAGTLHFTLDNQSARTEEIEFANNRGGVLFWNGEVRDRYAKHFPGEVRS